MPEDPVYVRCFIKVRRVIVHIPVPGVQISQYLRRNVGLHFGRRRDGCIYAALVRRRRSGVIRDGAFGPFQFQRILFGPFLLAGPVLFYGIFHRYISDRRPVTALVKNRLHDIPRSGPEKLVIIKFFAFFIYSGILGPGKVEPCSLAYKE